MESSTTLYNTYKGKEGRANLIPSMVTIPEDTSCINSRSTCTKKEDIVIIKYKCYFIDDPCLQNSILRTIRNTHTQKQGSSTKGTKPKDESYV